MSPRRLDPPEIADEQVTQVEETLIRWAAQWPELTEAQARLRALRLLALVADRLEGRAMQQTLAEGGDLRVIGDELGMSPQAAGKRLRQHHQLDDPRLADGRTRPANRRPYRRRASVRPDADG